MRTWMGWCGLAALLLWIEVFPVRAATPLVLGHNSPVGGPQDLGARSFAAELDRLMPDHFVVDIRGGSTVGIDADVFQQVKLGALDMAICATLSFSNQVPELAVLDLPFLFRDRTHVAHVLDGPIGDQLGEALARQQVTGLAFGELGFRQLTNNRRPVTEPADLAGLKLRMAPSDIYLLSFKTLGATTVSMNVTDVFAAARDGRIDGQENPLAVIKANRFDEVQKYLSMTGHFYAATAYMINSAVFAKLTPEEQAAVRQAARISAAQGRTVAAEQDSKLIKDMQAEGVQVTVTVDRDAFVKALAPVQPEFDRRFGADLIARIRATP